MRQHMSSFVPIWRLLRTVPCNLLAHPSITVLLWNILSHFMAWAPLLTLFNFILVSLSKPRWFLTINGPWNSHNITVRVPPASRSVFPYSPPVYSLLPLKYISCFKLSYPSHYYTVSSLPLFFSFVLLCLTCFHPPGDWHKLIMSVSIL